MSVLNPSQHQSTPSKRSKALKKPGLQGPLHWFKGGAMLVLLASGMLFAQANAATISPSSDVLGSELGTPSPSTQFSMQLEDNESFFSVLFCENSCGSDGAGTSFTGPGSATVPADNTAGEWQLDFDCPTAQACTLDVQFLANASGNYNAEIQLFAFPGSADIPILAASASVTGVGFVPDPAGFIDFSTSSFPGSGGFSVSEDEGALLLTFERFGGTEGEIGLGVSTGGGTAQPGVDYESISTGITMGDGETGPITLEIPILADALFEDPETFFINLDGGDSGSYLVTINDSDPPQRGLVQFVPNSYSVNEDAQTVTLNVVREGGTAGEIMVEYGSENDSATAGVDYGATSGTLTWADGQGGSMPIEIPIFDDPSTEDTKSFSVTLEDISASSQPSIGQNPTAIVEIDNVGPRGNIVFSETSYATSEDSGTVVITLLREGGSNGEIGVDYLIEADNATPGEDFISQSGGLDWANGELDPMTIEIEILTDDITEEPETFFLQLSNGTFASVTIEDVPPFNPGTVQLTANNFAVSETDGVANITLNRTGGSDGMVSFIVSTNDGSALAGEDYTSTNQTVSWMSGQSGSRTVPVPILTDQVIDDDEVFEVQLTPADSESELALGDIVEASVSISDVPPFNPGTIAFSQTPYTVSEDGTSITITAARTGGSDGSIEAIIRTVDGSATAGSDYTATSSSIFWTGGFGGELSVDVPILTDDVVDPDETFQVILEELITLNSLPEPVVVDEAVVTITDVPPPMPGNIVFSLSNYNIGENDGTVNVIAQRVGGDDGEIDIGYTTVDGTAVSDPDSPDFNASEGILTWADGNSEPQTIQIDILPDEDGTEGDEFFTVLLRNQESTQVTITDVPPEMSGEVNLTQTVLTVSETSQTVTVTATRTGGSDGMITAAITTEDVTAVAGLDYTFVSQNITWLDGQSGERTVEIPILTDALDEDDETFIARLGAVFITGDPVPGGSLPVIADIGEDNEALITITDVPPPMPGNIVFSMDNYSIGETDGMVSVVAQRVGGDDGEIVISYTTVDGTATSDPDADFPDYAGSEGTLTWLDGDSEPQTILIQILSDEDGTEGDETFNVFLGNQQTTQVTITDVPPEMPGEVNLVQTDLTVSEDGQTVTVTATRTGGNDGMITASISTEDVTAVAGLDYTAVTQNITWLDGQSGERTVDIPILTDALVEEDETFIARLSAVDTGSDAGFIAHLSAVDIGPVIGEDNEAVITITDVPPEMPGEVNLVQTALTVSEDGQAVTVTAVRTGGSDGMISAFIATEDVTAEAGLDYTAVTQNITWMDGESGERSVSIPILTDALVEENETFVALLSDAESSGDGCCSTVIGEDDEAIITITDVPPEMPGEVNLVQTALTVSEDGQTVTVTATRTGGNDGMITASISTEDVTAVAGLDYTAVTQNVTWLDGQSGQRTVDIPILTDELVEEDETFIARLSAVGTGGEIEGDTGSNAVAIIGEDNEAVITITDVPPEMPGEVNLVQTALTVSEDGQTVTVTATRTGGNDGMITASISTEDVTAVAGLDYTAVTQNVTWLDGQSGQRTVDIPILTDELVEEDETFIARLSAVGSGDDTDGVVDGDSGSDDSALIGDNNEALITITDVPPLNPGIIQFAPVNYTALESDSEVTITAVRQQGTDGQVTVVISTLDVSAVAGDDFEETSLELTWNDGESQAMSFTIPLIVDDTAEDTETFQVLMTTADQSAEGMSILGPQTTATVTIEELPVVEPGTLQFSSSTYSVSETDGSVELAVTRTGGTDGALAVNVSTSNGSADAGEDYQSIQTQLNWADGESGSRTFSVDIEEDELSENSETFTAVLSVPSGQPGNTLGSPSVAVVTITNVDPPLETGTVQFTAARVTVDEDDESVRVQISRTGGQDGPISMSVRGLNGSAEIGDDFQFENRTVTWADQDDGVRNIDIPIEMDSIEEPNETFRVRLVANDANSAALGSPSEVVVTIRNVSDPLEAGVLSIAQQNYTVTEAQGMVTVRVNRTGGSEGAVSVQYNTDAGSADSPADFTDASGTLEWADGDSAAKQFSISVAEDILVENDEQFEVTLSNAQSPDDSVFSVDRDSATVTIEDSTEPGSLQFSSTEYSAEESAESVQFSVERVDGSDGPVSVDYQLQALTATASVDYVSVTGTLNWGDGDSAAKSATIQLLNDSDIEDPETFEIILSNAQPVGDSQISQGLATVEIIDSTVLPTEEGIDDPITLTIISGDDQSLLPGDLLDPLVLQASVEPDSTRSVAGVAIDWRVEPAGSAELLDGDQTLTNEDGMASNQVRVLDRGFVRVIARPVGNIDASSSGLLNGRIAAPNIDLAEGEIAFTLRSGLGPAPGLNNNQSQTGTALDSACVALAASPDGTTGLTAAQLDLQATCNELDARLRDGSVAPALDRLAPEEVFTLGDSVIDTTDLQITNVYSRINALRSGRTDALDVSGLNLNIRGERIPGAVVEAAQDQIPSGGAASADDVSGFGPRIGVFANGAVSVGEVDGDENQRDADISTTGLTIGMDYRVSDNAAIGFGLGIANNETDFSGDEGRVDTSAVNVSLFATYYEEETGYVDVVLDVGQNQFDIERAINLPGEERRLATGSTDASVLSLTIGAGFDKSYGAVEFGPYGRLSIAKADVDGYRENADSDGRGSGSVLAIESHSIRSTTVSIGAQLSRSVSTKRGVFVPQLRVEGELELVDKKDGIKASFQHDPTQTEFEVNGNPRDESYLNLGLGSTFLLANGRSGYLFYETRAAHEFVTQHWLKLGFRLEFR